ncbi:MAG: NUDIX domain-containing protein [Rhodospirillales bacterium]|nr:NUDIX domain-containing protein [Rhodospirillales bacterium]
MTGLAASLGTCANADLDQFRTLLIDGAVAGRVHRRRAPFLLERFRWLRHDRNSLRWDGDDPCSRTSRLAEAMPILAEAEMARTATGEQFDVVRPFGGIPLAQCDRALLPAFGFPGYGVHLVGYVAHADGPRIWIPRRAHDRDVAPGQLDNTVGGGIASGMSVAETLRKEAWEEAGLEPALVDTARPAGALAYVHQEGEFLRDDTLFVYDLSMPPEIRPRNLDGEVQDFSLMPWQQVLELLRDGTPFKFNCGPVLIDFLLRHGLLDPDREPDYSGLARILRRPAH